MKCLLTGATGFLGSRILRALLHAGHEVVILKRSFSDTRRIADLLSSVWAFDSDRDSVDAPFRKADRFDAVVHCATCYGRAGENYVDVFEANTAFPLRLLDAAAGSGVGVFINSDSVLPKDINEYSLAKAHFREWARYVGEREKIGIANLKFDHFYGPGDDSNKFTSFVMESCRANIEEINLTAGGQQRDFIYIDDVVSAYLVVLKTVALQSAFYREYEVGTGRSVTIRKFVETVHALTNSSTRLNFGAIPYRRHELMISHMDIAPLVSMGWAPRFSLEDGIKVTLRDMSSCARQGEQ